MTDIQITVGDQTFTAQLADNPTARDLEHQLPLTLRFRDFNRVEKIAKLPRPLTMDGVPAGDDPRSMTSAITPPRVIWFSTTAMSVTGRDRTDRWTRRRGHERHRAPTRRVRTDD